MIDIEADVFDIVQTAIKTAYPSADVSSTYTDTVSRFPAVTIIEADNRIFTRMRTENIENAVRVMYDMNVFSNSSTGKKQEAKAICDVADAAFESLGFTRTFREQVPNMRDATIYRIVCRYEAVIGAENGGIFLVYQS